MRCIRPTKFDKNGVFVRCGQCMPCRVVRRQEWQTKLTLEWLSSNKKAVFTTLTYAPEFLPKGGTLVKEDAQKFIKRFRFHCDHEIRYFIVGEYGDKYKRPHYHAIIYGVDLEEARDLVSRSWKLGITQTDLVHVNRLRYTVGYTIKKMTRVEDFPDGRLPEFSLMSRKPALGTFALDRIADLLIKRGLYPARGTTQEGKWILRENGISLREWNGVFLFDDDLVLNFPMNALGWKSALAQKKFSVARLDANMMTKLAELVNYRISEFIESETPLFLPKSWKVYKDRLVHQNYLAIMDFVVSEEYDEAKKKSSKFERLEKTRKALSGF